jgi:hypothetical protein
MNPPKPNIQCGQSSTPPPIPPQTPYLLSVRRAAEYLGRTEKAVRHLYERRTLTPLRIDGRVFLDRREIDALFERARAQSY